MVLWQHVFYVADVFGCVMTGPPLVCQCLRVYHKLERSWNVSHSLVHWRTSNVWHGMHSHKLSRRSFWRNVTDRHYTDIVDNLFGRVRILGCNMGLRLRYWHSHLDYFPGNWGRGVAVKKLDEKVSTNILKEMQRRWQGGWALNKMAAYCSPSNEQPHSLYSKLSPVHQTSSQIHCTVSCRQSIKQAATFTVQ